MEEYSRYKDSAIQLYNQQRELHLQLRGGEKHCPFFHSFPLNSDSLAIVLILCQHTFPIVTSSRVALNYHLSGVDTDELDSNVEDWEEETIEFFINEEIIPLGDLE